MVSKTDRPLWRGRTNVSAVVQAQVEFAESRRRGTLKGKKFVITQGSFQGGHGDLNSAGTHDKDGCIDIRWTGNESDLVALREAGLWAYHRTPSQGPWPDHIHAVSLFVARNQMSRAAVDQLDDALANPRRNGLANNGPDDGPDAEVLFKWPVKPKTPNITKALKARTREARLEALALVVKHGSAAAKKAAQGYIDAIKALDAAEKKVATQRARLTKQEVS